jgi:aspartyl-tRNA(Asn)/glutamyl-tRNA(Gln) amidotransferase subunit C
VYGAEQGKAAPAERDCVEREAPRSTTADDPLYTRKYDVKHEAPPGPHVACALIMTEQTTEPKSTSTRQEVSEEQVRQVAALANLELTPEELPAMGRDLNAILGYIAQLNELDVAKVAPMAQVSEILPDAARGEAEGTPLREDTPVPCLERAPVMQAAPETDGAFFKVPQVIGR